MQTFWIVLAGKQVQIEINEGELKVLESSRSHEIWGKTSAPRYY